MRITTNKFSTKSLSEGPDGIDVFVEVTVKTLGKMTEHSYFMTYLVIILSHQVGNDVVKRLLGPLRRILPPPVLQHLSCGSEWRYVAPARLSRQLTAFFQFPPQSTAVQPCVTVILQLRASIKRLYHYLNDKTRRRQ